MRLLRRNKQTVSYSVYVSKADKTDDYGNKTGEQVVTYGTPATMQAYVTAAKGDAALEIFGVDTSYTKVIYTDDMNCPINELTHIWIGRSTSSPYNYAVTRVARSLNHIAIAVKEVNTQ